MQGLTRIRKSVLATLALILIASPTVSVSGHAAASDDTAPATLRERIKQRRLNAQQRKRAPESGSDQAAKLHQPGDYTFAIRHEGLARHYLLHLPEKYRATNPAPLVLAFHGGGGDMQYMSTDKYYGLISKADAEGFVVVFPNGYSKLRSGKFATWNAGSCCGAARDRNVDDVGFVRKIIAHVSARLSIDRNRLYATGMSNGGMMAYRLACEMPDTIKAIAAVAGTDNTARCTPDRPVSILHIHAKNDDRVLYNGGAGASFRDKAKVSDFVSVPATLAKWVEHNGCDSAPHRVVETAGAYCDSYSQCRGNAQVQLCVTETGGHSWPGGYKPRAAEPPSQAISADDVMWAFFSAVQRQTVGNEIGFQPAQSLHPDAVRD